ncbi:alpha/beta fold hydrolase [Janthinobacterium sp. AD80]|uniref:alpha/beta fold hydrolase n=1 Tax=Janthinobacterium sp. AD80 TaxID=1528773 RepID=UPI000C81AD43|nr:alpha/beta hydrolase [Janthinobacterium sp. AD80]PMQ15958.1 Haloacetate dehalogenase H-1 [Janthinobacterium sp. AD80]
MHHLFVGRPARTILLGSAGLLLSACSLMPSKPAAPGVPATAALPDATIAYTLAGHGAVPVVFQSAMGDGKDVWAKVVPEVAQQHRVLVYDRPGYGDSQKTSTPRDPCTIAAQQRALLAQAGLKPPYVLVGHGLGGLYQYVYARLYPQDVAGLVLLDPTHPQQWSRMQTEASTYAMLLKTRRKLMFNSAESAEFDAQAQCLQHVDMTSPLRIPAMLLVRDKFGIEETGSFENLVRAQEKDWQRLSGAPAIERITGTGYYIQKDNPVIVNEAVKMVTRKK